MENMFICCCMGDMINMFNGEVLIINGVMNGFQGWGKVSNVVLNFVNYNFNVVVGRCFVMWVKIGIFCVYYFIVSLFVDGRVIVVGSNIY